MTTEWGLTLGALVCAGLIIIRMTVEPANADSQGWKWDASHRCRLVLLGKETREGVMRIRIGNESFFPVRYQLVAIPEQPILIEAWPGTVAEVVLPASATTNDIHVPDCRRRI